MRKITLLFVIVLGLLRLQTVYADDEDIARAAKRNSGNTVVSSRQKTDNQITPITSSVSRSTISSQKSDYNTSNNINSSGRDNRNVTTRINTNNDLVNSTSISNINNIQSIGVQNRSAINQKTTSERNGIVRYASETPSISARSATVTRAAKNNNKTTNGESKKARSAASSRTSVARAATNINEETPPQASNSYNNKSGITNSSNYQKCREVFYSCMDEFCANKDTQLKRCACSSRVHDFDNTKTNMSKIEDKILDFNERLLTVSMDEEDAEAISQATEGEIAYQQKDKSDSKSILDEISKKLKSDTNNDKFTNNLSAISLSLNSDSAFDSVDSTLGESTSTKEGTNLYNAALPICREMAAEVCNNNDDAAIAESAYQMSIEQDCNTVKKAYTTMQDEALEKIREGSALLDMSRLNTYQDRNSDDILTCKKKMLEMMTSESVCGKDLSECLDITGRYIDPSTGEAFLTVDLVNLENLLTRPAGDQKWTEVSGNKQFISFLKSKKTYLESAMDSCQDISDTVWDDFLEDALAQIKLAQDAKLEDMRQSCTALTTQCLSDTADSIADFDARALSTFGVKSDKTVNEMCSEIKTACTALLESSYGGSDWVAGMDSIQTTETYENIIDTCREVGKACIIETCTSVSGNFGLCESIDKSVNRKSIINRYACWNEVVECVTDAGTDAISNIMTQYNKTPTDDGGDWYSELYGSLQTRTNTSTCNIDSQSCIYDICASCGTPGYASCSVCRLAEKIWGNCEFAPTTDLDVIPTNMIKMPPDDDTETLLSWFAENTGTADLPDSCRDTTCGVGYVALVDASGTTTCELADNVSNDKVICTEDDKLYIASDWTNCCADGVRDEFGNCCDATKSVTGVDVDATSDYFNNNTSVSADICTNTSNSNITFVAMFDGDGIIYRTGLNVLLCIGSGVTASETAAAYPNGQKLTCNGVYIVIDLDAGTYSYPNFNITSTTTVVPAANYYYLEYPSNSCLLNSTPTTVTWDSMTTNYESDGVNANCSKITGYPNITNNLYIHY